MAEGREEDRLAVIISYLKQQGAALATIDRRMESLGADIKMIGDSVRDISRRQSELESSSAGRQSSCREVMDGLATRIFALEQMITPIPKRISAKDLMEFQEERLTRKGDGNGGNIGDTMLSLSMSSMDDDEGDKK